MAGDVLHINVHSVDVQYVIIDFIYILLYIQFRKLFNKLGKDKK